MREATAERVMAAIRVGVDAGGTFSDFVVLDEATGEIEAFKVSSTPDAPERAILAGLDRILAAGIDAGDVRLFIHGTTVATNALLEGKGARTGLVISEGMRGIYEVQEQARPYGPPTFDIRYVRPAPLVPPRRTVEVRERVGADGSVVVPFDEASARAALETLKAAEVEAVAVCLLFSFLHPEHERRVRAVAAEILPGVPVSLSCEVAPLIREYPRLSTTLANAYLQPALGTYLRRLDEALAERGVITPQRYVMLSHGGVTPIATAGGQAAAAVLSGLAGGVMGAAAIASEAGIGDALALDMGGTSCDVAVIVGGEPERRQRGEIEGRPIALPTLGVETLSAGGGTIVRVDAAGLLQVGPDSAGAAPGPVAYGRGGREPTITDCNLVLGYLGGDGVLADGLVLDANAARAAVERRLAAPTGLSGEAAALGALRLIDVRMGEAVRAMATGRGLDLRDFTLVAGGGAGALHAARIAKAIGLVRVLIPRNPGVTSALGLLHSDVRYEAVQARPARIEALEGDALAQELAALAEGISGRLGADGFARDETALTLALDLRYEGQGYEVTTPVEEPVGTAIDLHALRARFDALHRMRFGHGAEDAAVELMACRATGIGRVPRPRATPPPADQALDLAIRGRRPMVFAMADGLECVEAPLYARAQLGPGHRFQGPALLEQEDATTLVPPGWQVEVDALGNLMLREGGST